MPKTIDISVGFDEAEVSSNPALSFSKLNKMQELAIAGHSREEIDQISRSHELTDEERDAILKSVMKEQRKEMRQYNRMLKKQAEERELQKIYRKAF
jgi:gluconate kinase